MSITYQEILDARKDMTGWVLHFTHKSNSSGHEIPAREVLLRILIDGWLQASDSVRNGRPTIYGPRKAVCFTEQPIGAFLKYLDARKNREHMDAYGILVRKKELFEAGGLPVIYGLPDVSEVAEREPEYQPGVRLISPAVLIPDQQYRYVVFAYDRDPPIDWSHEREWRWAARTDDGIHSEHFRLELPRSSCSGNVNVFVERDPDIKWLQDQIGEAVSNDLRYQDSEAAGDIEAFNEDNHFFVWKKRLRRVNVISLETARREISAGNDGYSRFEDWPAGAIHKLWI